MRFLAIFLSFLLPFGLAAQTNLVVNPSFEQLVPGTEQGLDMHISSAYGWDSPNDGDTRMYGSDNSGNVYDSYGANWPFTARTGALVATMNVYGGAEEAPKRDYIQGQLSQPLEVGKKYYFSFWVHYHCEGANNIGIVFLPRKLKTENPGLIPLQPASWQVNVTPYSRTEAWAQVQDSFIAYQPYQYFLIGNFFPNSQTSLESRNYNHYFAYVDDIRVKAAEDTRMPEGDRDSLETAWTSNVMTTRDIGTFSVTLEDLKPWQNLEVFFDLDSDRLRKEDKARLDELIEFIRGVPAIWLTVKGSASEEGTNSYNSQLAARRAMAVKDYLRSKGIMGLRINLISVGEDPMRGQEDAKPEPFRKASLTLGLRTY